MRAALFGFIIAILGSLALMPALGHVGVAIAIAVSGWASAGLLGVLIARRIGFGIDAHARYRLPRIALAAAIMGLLVEAAHRILQPWLGAGAQGIIRATVLAALIGFGLAVYIALLRTLKVASPRDLLRAVGRGSRF
jgi:putative peptidoglycan lipid II flippase